MRGSSVSIRYARALYDAAFSGNVLDTVIEDIQSLKQILNKTPQILRYCLGYHANRIQEEEFIKIAFLPYVGVYTGQTLKLAAINGRLDAIPLIPDAFLNILERESGKMSVLLETVQEPGEELLERVKEKMKTRTGSEILLSWKITPAILGGIRIIWDNKMIDLSASGRIKKFRTLLKTV